MNPKAVTAVVTAQDKYWDYHDETEYSITVETGIAGETLTVLGVVAAFQDTEVGENKTVILRKAFMDIQCSNGMEENYIVTVPDTVTASIKAIPLTISGVTMDASSYTYGDTVGYNSTALTLSQPGGQVAQAGEMVYTYTGTANDGSVWNDTAAPTKAGTYTLTVSHSDTEHYTGSQTLSFTIQRKSVQEPNQAADVIYNGTAQTYAVTETAEYTVTGGVQTAANESGYDVTISLKDKDNYQWETAANTDDLTHKFIIRKAPATITALDQRYHVGRSLPQAAVMGEHYTIQGLVGQDSIGTVTIKYQKDGLDVIPDSKRTGSYDILMQVANANANYDITFVNGKLIYYYIPVYAPTVTDTEGGEVTLSTSYPALGQTVTITVAPDENMAVAAVTVTDDKGNAVEVTKNVDGSYRFTQPEGNVRIKVTFRPEGGLSEAYSDLDTNAWYHEAVNYVLQNGLMNGMGGGKFQPNATTSRAMIVTILWRLEGSPVVNYLMDFEDVAADTWYTEAIRWAASEKIVEGYGNGKFGTNDAITREQLATVLYRYEQHKGGGFKGTWMFLLDYSDRASISQWAYEPLCWMTMKGVMEGKGEKLLDPKGSATRAEMATMLMRYCQLEK